ncbi:rhamnan synthesis F family protein [Chthonobacter albigriseus]|uniref:rhamnan synthesis F family protein n=1 Tax=Chthonobacter albigriseus TaxID=1683161 RepID=UPI0015EEACBA|nr:rhamnan synthesis F family protein [Chthonobacter albigriseus]
MKLDRQSGAPNGWGEQQKALTRRILRRMVRAIYPDVQGRVMPEEQDHSLALPLEFAHAGPQRKDRFAVVCHIYYVEQVGEILSYLSNIPVKADVFISTDSPHKARVIETRFGSWPKGRIEIRVVPNRGRDIAPKYVTFRDCYDIYDLILFLHSKNTPQMKSANEWRRTMMNSLVGSPQTVKDILYMFETYPDLGVIFPQHYKSVRPHVRWQDMFYEARRVAQRMNIRLHPNQYIDFPAGSMFWARSSALQPILDLRLRTEDFPEEAGQTDNTIAHVLERLVLHVCESQGQFWLKVARPGDATVGGRKLQVRSREQLDALLASYASGQRSVMAVQDLPPGASDEAIA